VFSFSFILIIEVFKFWKEEKEYSYSSTFLQKIKSGGVLYVIYSFLIIVTLFNFSITSYSPGKITLNIYKNVPYIETIIIGPGLKILAARAKKKKKQWHTHL